MCDCISRVKMAKSHDERNGDVGPRQSVSSFRGLSFFVMIECWTV
jgi:hypothetical protein